MMTYMIRAARLLAVGKIAIVQTSMLKGVCNGATFLCEVSSISRRIFVSDLSTHHMCKVGSLAHETGSVHLQC